MSRFTEATFEQTGETERGRPVMQLTSDLAYDINYLGSGWTVYVRKGFRTDLVSMPTWFIKLPFICKVVKAMTRSAIVHDMLRKDERHPKLFGDYIFFQALEVDGVNIWCRTLAFVAVLLNFSRH